MSVTSDNTVALAVTSEKLVGKARKFTHLDDVRDRQTIHHIHHHYKKRSVQI